MELLRLKNQAATIKFPMVDKASPESLKSGETVSVTAYYDDGSGDQSLTISGSVSEIGSTGMYTLSLTAGEMNHNAISLKLTATNSADTVILINTQDLSEMIFGATVEGSLDLQEVLRIILAFAAGETTVSGSQVTFRDQADTKARITATVDNDTQRTSVTVDGS